MSDSHKYVYSFGGGKAEGKADMKTLLGGKGANLAEMSVIGIPVPPGFTITTEVCAAYYENGKKLARGRPKPQVEAAIKLRSRIRWGPSSATRCRPAARQRPVRCRAVDAGHDEHDPQPRPLRRLDRGSGQEDRQRPVRLRWLSPPDRHVRLGRHGRRPRAVRARAALPSRSSTRGPPRHRAFRRRPQAELVQKYKAVYKKGTGSDFPQDPKDQLWAAIMAVFNSWEGHKAIEYRRIEKITGLKGTAVNVQAMVFGNMGDNSGTGVAFTRDPNTGEDVVLRRLPDQRPGRGRRRGHPDPRADQPAPGRHAQGLRPTDGNPREARTALQGDAGHRVHRPGRDALHAPDPDRQADRAGPPSGSPSRWSRPG